MDTLNLLDAQDGFSSFSKLVVKLLTAGKSVGTAESCTGGMISALFTSVPGSSNWFKGGIVAYCNAIKENLLGVPGDVLSRHGAVSEETARAMAAGVRTLLGVECAIAVTGIAGPSGGTPEKAVGTVCFAWDVEGDIRSATCKFDGPRQDVRASSVNMAIQGLLQCLDGNPPHLPAPGNR